MNINTRKARYIIIIVGSVLMGYFLWSISHPVKIIAVHGDSNYSSVLVKNFPLTDKGKIDWWLKNKDMLKSRYNIPNPAVYGGYNITFWNFSDGYKEYKYDRLCFEDMQTKINCIDKESVLTIKRFNYEKEIFITYEGRYKLQGDGRTGEVHRE